MLAEIVLPVLQDIACGMRFLHASEIVHGDIKAANILVDRRFRAKVADFGLSSRNTAYEQFSSFWMAPELLRRTSAPSFKSDIYSFGILLYEVYSRKDPYSDEFGSEEDILKRISDPEINLRPTIPYTCPGKAKTLIVECWSPLQQERPTFEELDLQLKRMNTDSLSPNVPEQSQALSKTNSLLHTMFPEHIASELRDGKWPSLCVQGLTPKSREESGTRGCRYGDYSLFGNHWIQFDIPEVSSKCTSGCC